MLAIVSLLRDKPGFASAHRHLLGAHESHTGVPPPTVSGPTIFDFYAPDIDRHGSGLFCFARDHERSLASHDPDVMPPVEKQELEDILTDSESDDDEVYQKAFPAENSHSVSKRPSLSAARAILRAVPPPVVVPVSPRTAAAAEKAAKGKPAAAKAVEAVPPTIASPPPTADSMGAESFKLNDTDRRTDQVELMRDRKILDMEAIFRKKRYKDAEAVVSR